MSEELKGGLVLEIKEGDTLYLGDNIQIVLRRNRKGKIKTIIKAPKDIKIYHSGNKDKLDEQ